jgi:two-component system cell cycle response regulator
MSKAATSSILLVDDDEVVLTLIGKILESRGLDVVQASNGRDALDLISERSFSVMLTDWHMPVMDGMALAEEVRARGMDEICIVMHTVEDGYFDYERGREAGIDDYLAKRPPDVAWHARIKAALGTADLRRSVKAARASLAVAELVTPVIAGMHTPPLGGLDVPETGHSHATGEDFGNITQVMAVSVMPAPQVLLVDDDEIMVERLKIAITEMGHEVITATDGAAALALLRQHLMSVVVLDRNMPGLDGLELCRSIRRQTWPGYVYVILLTSHDAEKDILLGLDAGADDYLSKRVSDAELAARLSTATRVLSLEHSLKSAVEERQRMAMTDSLTGAHNRRYFMRHLRAELKRARRFGTELSLLALDIDYFKLINDNHGHAAGDMVLQKLVQRIKKFLPRECDWCARLGGEEFAVVLPQTDLAGAAVLAEDLRKAVEELSIRLSGEVRAITVSIGVSGLQAMPVRESATAEMLLAHADRYLYKSKESGRNRVASPKPHALAA